MLSLYNIRTLSQPQEGNIFHILNDLSVVMTSI